MSAVAEVEAEENEYAYEYVKVLRPKASEICQIAYENVLVEHEFNARERPVRQDVLDILESVRDMGVKVPIEVRLNPRFNKDRPPGKDNPEFALVSGFRRMTAVRCVRQDAAKSPGPLSDGVLERTEYVPALIYYDINEEQARLLNFRENLERVQLTYAEEAKGIERLVALGWTNQYIAQQLNQGTRWVSARRALWNLPPDVRESAIEAKLTPTQVSALARRTSATKDAMFEFIRQATMNKERGESIRVTNRTQKETAARVAKRVARGADEIATMRKWFLDQKETNEAAVACARLLSWVRGELSTVEIGPDLQAIYLIGNPDATDDDLILLEMPQV